MRTFFGTLLLVSEGGIARFFAVPVAEDRRN